MARLTREPVGWVSSAKRGVTHHLTTTTGMAQGHRSRLHPSCRARRGIHDFLL
jgi:hypothetical protein